MKLTEETQLILNLLEARSRSREIVWKRTGLSNELTTVIQGVAVVMDKWVSPASKLTFAELVVRNHEGKDVLREKYLAHEPEGARIAEVFEAALAAFNRKDETITTLLNGLRSPPPPS